MTTVSLFLTDISSLEAHSAASPQCQHVVAQFPQGGYVTWQPEIKLYLHGTPFVPPRSKTSDDRPSKLPAAQNKAWQAAGVSTSASGIQCVEVVTEEALGVSCEVDSHLDYKHI